MRWWDSQVRRLPVLGFFATTVGCRAPAAIRSEGERVLEDFACRAYPSLASNHLDMPGQTQVVPIKVPQKGVAVTPSVTPTLSWILAG